MTYNVVSLQTKPGRQAELGRLWNKLDRTQSHLIDTKLTADILMKSEDFSLTGGSFEKSAAWPLPRLP